MKTNTVNIVKSVYECESCGREWGKPSPIGKCSLCGGDACDMCKKNLNNEEGRSLLSELLAHIVSASTATLDYSIYLYVCQNCYASMQSNISDNFDLFKKEVIAHIRSLREKADTSASS